MDDRAGQSARARALIEEKWYGLDSHDLDFVRVAVAHMPPEVLAQTPSLFQVSLIGEAVGDKTLDGSVDLPKVLHLHSEAVPQLLKSLQEITDPDDLRAVAVALIIGFRMRGELDGADRMGEIAQQRIDAVAARHRFGLWETARLRPGNLEVQRGVTATLQGDFQRAMQFYRQSMALAGPPPYRHFAGANAAANLALLAAIEGYHGLTVRWLDELAGLGTVEGWAEELTNLGAYAARAQLAVDSLDEAEARAQLSHFASTKSGLELWPFLAVVEAGAGLAFGDPHLAHARFRAAGFAHGRDLTEERLADDVTYRTYLDLLIGMGQGGLALRLATEAGTPLRSLLPIARVYLLAGEPLEAARRAGVAIRQRGLPIRDLHEALGVLAVAQLQLGEVDEAKATFVKYATAQSGYHAAMNRRLPQRDLGELQRLTGFTLETGPPSVGNPVRSISLVRLTPKESEVLQRLAEGLTAHQIAGESGTSPQTVRTHIKRLYRKLDASTRQEAIAKAEVEGLLGWAG